MPQPPEPSDEERLVALVRKALDALAFLKENEGRIYVRHADGTLSPAVFSTISSTRAAELTTRALLVNRIRELTEGLSPHGKYDTESLADLVARLEEDPTFIGPFRGQEAWSAAPAYGSGAVRKHQLRRRRQSKKR